MHEFNFGLWHDFYRQLKDILLEEINWWISNWKNFSILFRQNMTEFPLASLCTILLGNKLYKEIYLSFQNIVPVHSY